MASKYILTYQSGYNQGYSDAQDGRHTDCPLAEGGRTDDSGCTNAENWRQGYERGRRLQMLSEYMEGI